MKLKKILVITALIVAINGSTAFAQKPASNSYKQGIYNLSEPNSTYEATMKLITKELNATLMIIDKNGKLKFYKLFDNVYSSSNIHIDDGDTIIIVGKGEVLISPIQ